MLTVSAPTIQESKLDKVIAQSAKLPRSSFSDVQITGCDFTATDMAEASWHRVSFKASRCSSLQLPNSTLKDVSFVGCKLNLANFRFASLSNVLFDDCMLDEADFYAAKLNNVRFKKCIFVKAQFSTATLFRTDFRMSDLYGIAGITGLAGATIDSAQLAGLAPLFAAQLKIEVRDD